MTTNIFSQRPAQLDWEYVLGDFTSLAVTIATDPAEEVDLEADPVTAMAEGPGKVGLAFTVEVVEPDMVRLTPPESLPPGDWSWWVKWRDRTILARTLRVLRPGVSGGSMLSDQTVIVEAVDYVVQVTLQNGGIPGPNGEDPEARAAAEAAQAAADSAASAADGMPVLPTSGDLDADATAAKAVKTSIALKSDTYAVTAAVDYSATAAADDLAGMVGRGKFRSVIRQDTAGTAGVIVGGRGMGLRGMSVVANATAAATDTGSIGVLVLGNDSFDLSFSEIADLYIAGFRIGLGVDASMEFSNAFRDIRVSNWYRAAYQLGGTGASGSLHENLYASAIGVTGVFNMLESTGFSAGEFNRLNLERTTVRNAVIYGATHNLLINGLHNEEVSLIGRGSTALRSETLRAAFYRTNGHGVQRIRNWSIDSCHVGGYIVTSLTRSGTTATATLELMDFQQKVASGHGIEVGDTITVAGADDSAYNGAKTVTAVTATTVEYTVAGSPTTPAAVVAGSDCIVINLGGTQLTAVPLVLFEGGADVEIDGLYIRDTRCIAPTAAQRTALFRAAAFASGSAGKLKIRGLRFGNQVDNHSNWLAPMALAGYSRTSNVTTLWFSQPHNLRTDSVVTVKGATDTSFNGANSGSLTAINEFAVSFAQTGSDKALTRDTTATAYLQTVAITNAARTSDIVTITTSAAHNMHAGNTVAVACSETGVDTNNALVLSTPTPTTFTYRAAGTDIASGAATGSVMWISGCLTSAASVEVEGAPMSGWLERDWLDDYCIIFAPGLIAAGATGAQTTNVQVGSTDKCAPVGHVKAPHDSLTYKVIQSAARQVQVRAFNPTGSGITPDPTPVFVKLVRH